MSAVRELISMLIKAGMDPADAAAMVARAGAEMAPPADSRTAGARRQAAYRERNKASLNVTEVTADQTSLNVTNRNETSLSDAASLYKKESKKEESKKVRGVTRASQIPEGWRPDEHVWQATVILVGEQRCELELTKFRNHAADKGRVSKNWNAAWRNWIDKSIEYRGQNGNGKTQDNPRAGSLIGALDRAIAKAELEEELGLEVPADNLLSLPSRSVQRS